MSVKAELLCLEYRSPHLFSLCGVCWAVSGTLWNPRGHTLKCSPPLCLVTQSYLTFATPWTVGHQAPLCTGFSRQAHCSGLPLPPPGGLPDTGITFLSRCLLHCRQSFFFFFLSFFFSFFFFLPLSHWETQIREYRILISRGNIE